MTKRRFWIGLLISGMGMTANAQSFSFDFKVDFKRGTVSKLQRNSTVVLVPRTDIYPFGDLVSNWKPTYLGTPPTEEDARAKLGRAALTAAEDNYFLRGARYQYGPNDCSTFVCDFIENFSRSVSRRFTTDRLFSPAFMARIGYVEVTNLFADLQEYDIVVFRYFDSDFMTEGGHCGILVWRDGKLCVEHNSSSNKGLARTPIEEFYGNIAGIKGLRGPKIFRWAGSPK
jgi:hypothetical protein